MLSISGAFVGTHSPKSCFWCCRPVRYKKVHGSCWVDFHGPTSFTFLVCFTERTGSRNCKPGINNRQQMCFLFIQNSKKWPDNEQVRGVYSVKTLVRLGCTFRHDRWPEVNGRKWSLLGFSHHPACSPLVITVGGPERFDQLRFKTNAFLRRQQNKWHYITNNHTLNQCSSTFSVLHSAVTKNRPDPVSPKPTTPQNPSEAAN